MGRYIGIDLAGVERNPSGVCYVRGRVLVEIGSLYSDDELISWILSRRPTVVAIDAPFGLPRQGKMRDVDSLMKRLGLNPLPPVLEGMRKLVERTVRLIEILQARRVVVLETFPAGVIRVLGYRRKPRSFSERYRIATELLRAFGIRRDVSLAHLSPHEFDALLCALTAFAYDHGLAIGIRGDEGTVWFASLNVDDTLSAVSSKIGAEHVVLSPRRRS